MKQNNFAVMPSVGITRSKFKRTSQHKTAFNLGDIVPIYCDEVLPGDTRNISLGSLVRMSTPVVPIMDNIYLDFYAFFVPNRLCWDHWKEFMGENTSAAGAVNPETFIIPQVDIKGLKVGTIGDYLGLPVGLTGTSNLMVSTLPIRALRLIYNRWFRDQNSIAPLVVNKGDLANSYDSYDVNCFKAAKFSDYFTRALPYAQKGSPVTIPMLGNAAVRAVEGVSSIVSNGVFKLSDGDDPYSVITGSADSTGHSSLNVGDDGALGTDTDLYYGSGLQVNPNGLVADLSSATAATINQLRFAFQYQKLLEKDAIYGSRYWELLHAHFGVNAPDASLQDPEYLGHGRMNINIDQVLGTVNNTDTDVGQPGANSVSAFSGNLFTKSFTEHGHLIIVAVARHDQTYAQGLNRMWSRVSRTDYYFPVFANLGAQKVLKKEIYAQVTSADDQVFGYQEAWSEYRYKPSQVTGLLRPNASDNLGFWTLANKFDAMPTLGQTFLEQDRSALSRSLVTGASGPDFIADFYFNDIAVRPMPMYSIPGLIDHH